MFDLFFLSIIFLLLIIFVIVGVAFLTLGRKMMYLDFGLLVVL